MFNHEYEKIKIENNVSFFDYLKGIDESIEVDEKTMEIFNYKLKQTENQYNMKLKGLLTENKQLFQQLVKFKVIKETLQMELTLEEYVRKMLQVVETPEELWEEVNS